MAGYFFLRPGALGDLLLCTPLMAALREAQPAAGLALAGHYGAGRLLSDAGWIDRAIDQDDPRLLPLFGSAGGWPGGEQPWGEIDYAVAWLADRDGVVAANLARWARRRVVVAPSLPEPDRPIPVTEHLFATVRDLGIGCDRVPAGPLLSATAGDRAWAKAHLDTRWPGGGPVIALHPGSGAKGKNWTPAGFATVANRLSPDFRVVLVGGPADEEEVRATAALCRGPTMVVRELSLPHLAALLGECAAYVGNDSGVTHLAALLGRPVVAIFGPSDPRLWRPWGRRVVVLRWNARREEVCPRMVADAVVSLVAG